jgi:G:T-mismatch repair DNA endonuclease (very short patch repair protein)
MEINCDNCGKSFNKIPSDIKKHKNHFCCKKCKNEWLAKQTLEKFDCSNLIIKDGKIRCECNICGEEIWVYPSKYETIINKQNGIVFCSKSCRHKYDGLHFSGEGNPNYKTGESKHICEQCNTEYSVRDYRKDVTRFCSRECKDIWMKENLKLDKEYVEYHRQIGIKCMKEQKNKKTKPEIMVEEYLKCNNIQYEYQYEMYDKYVVDFYLPTYDAVVEVFGDYWHGNPNKYGENLTPLNEVQVTHMERDKKRIDFFHSTSHKFYILWECDIYKDLKEIMSSILITRRDYVS